MPVPVFQSGDITNDENPFVSLKIWLWCVCFAVKDKLVTAVWRGNYVVSILDIAYRTAISCY